MIRQLSKAASPLQFHFAYVSIGFCPQTFGLQCIAISHFLVVLSAAAFVIAASVCPDNHGASEPRRRALLGHTYNCVR